MRHFKISLIFDEGTEDGIKVFRINKREGVEDRFQPIVLFRPTNVTYIYEGLSYHFSGISNPLSYFKDATSKLDDVASKMFFKNRYMAYSFDEDKTKNKLIAYLRGEELEEEVIEDIVHNMNFDGKDIFINSIWSYLVGFISVDDCCSVQTEVLTEYINNYFIDVVKDIASIAEFMENKNG